VAGLQEIRLRHEYIACMKALPTMMAENRVEEARRSFERLVEDRAFEEGRDILGNIRFQPLKALRGLCFLQLSNIADESGDKDSALRQIGQAILHDEKDVVRWNKLGTLAMHVNRLNLARCAFERLLEMRPHYPLFLDKLCEVTYRIGDFYACRSAMEMLLAIVPAHPRGLVFKGLLLCQHKSTEEEGQEILEEAQAVEGALPKDEVELLRCIERKRPRRQAPPAPPPRPIALAQPSWLCLLENVLGAIGADTHNVRAIASLADTAPSTPTNPVCVLSLKDAPMEVEPWEAGAVAADHRPLSKNMDAAVAEQTDNATRGCQREGVGTEGGSGGESRQELSGEREDGAGSFQEADARCSVCLGDEYDGDELLLCEEYERCGQSCHTTCLARPLDRAPQGEWFCGKCQAHGLGAGEGKVPEAVGECLSPMPGCENSRDSVADGDGLRGGGGEASAWKRGGRRSRSANLSANSVPSRKSRRQSQVDADKRPSVAAQLAFILELVQERQETGADEGDDEDGKEEAGSPRRLLPAPAPAPAGHLGLLPLLHEGPGETLSRFEMLQRLSAAGAEDVFAARRVRALLGELVGKPICLLELVHKLLHTVAGLVCEARFRGKVVEDLLRLERAVRGRLTFSAEASLLFAELNLDQYELMMSKKGSSPDADPAAPPQQGSGDEAAAMEADDEPPATTRDEPTRETYLEAYEAHVKGLWGERFRGWREAARYFWLLARGAACRRKPWNVIEPLQRCKAVIEAAHADAQAAAAAVILLPSCQRNNCITLAGIERCAVAPQQQVREVILDQQALELELAMSEAQAAAADRQGQDDEMELQQKVREIAERIVKTLAPLLIQDAEANSWLVTQALTASKAATARTEKHLEQLRKACSELAGCFKQELYILNVMLTQVVSAGSPLALAERRDEGHYAPLALEARVAGKHDAPCLPEPCALNPQPSTLNPKPCWPRRCAEARPGVRTQPLNPEP